MSNPGPVLSRVLGGPLGRHARPGGLWFSPAPWTYLALTVSWLIVMVRQIRAYEEATGFKVGYKPAGGIRTAKQALEYLLLMKEELGDRWLQSGEVRLKGIDEPVLVHRLVVP